MDTPSVTAEIALDADVEIVAVKIQADAYELNVFLNATDIDCIMVADLPMAPDEVAICAGECCGAPAHWARDNASMMSIVIGFDDTTWDVGVWMPYSMFSTIKSLLSPLRLRLARHDGG